ncbi:MAG TPA: amidohydrolase family protein [Thermodesulfobacteriota bacterium]
MLIRCGLLIDGVSTEPKRRASIRVEGANIATVGEDLAPAPGEPVLDLGGYTVVPGFVDCHDHLGFDAGEPKDRLTAEPNEWVMAKMVARARWALEAGVTTLRDMGEKNHVDLLARRAIAEGLFPGPRLLVAGRSMTMTGGTQSWFEGTEVDGPEEIRKHVRREVKAGVDVLKMFATGSAATLRVDMQLPCFTKAEMTVAAEEAHRAGRRLGVHAHSPIAARWAVEAGADTIEHGVFLDEEVLALMAERRVPLILTSGYFQAAAARTDVPEYMRDRSKAALDRYLETMAAARRLGVPVAVGTDENHGRIDMELAFMVKAGYTPLEALRAATAAGAAACGLADRTGAIRPGLAADLVALAENPLERVEAVARVVLVMKDGVTYVDRTRSAGQ